MVRRRRTPSQAAARPCRPEHAPDHRVLQHRRPAASPGSGTSATAAQPSTEANPRHTYARFGTYTRHAEGDLRRRRGGHRRRSTSTSAARRPTPGRRSSCWTPTPAWPTTQVGGGCTINDLIDDETHLAEPRSVRDHLNHGGRVAQGRRHRQQARRNTLQQAAPSRRSARRTATRPSSTARPSRCRLAAGAVGTVQPAAGRLDPQHRRPRHAVVRGPAVPVRRSGQLRGRR